jgi:hypothetical protein
MMNEAPIDIFIPVKNDPHYRDFLPICLRSLLTNVQHPIGAVVLVSPEPIPTERLPSGPQYRQIEERSFSALISQHVGLDWEQFPELSSNWVRQQIFKLYCFLASSAEDILVVDADLCFLKPIRFRDEHGRYCFYMENEHYPPYFQTIERLLGLNKATEKSFISDHILFSSARLRELISRVEERSSCSFPEALSRALRENRAAVPALSEYETYGTYLLRSHPELVGPLIPNPHPGLPHFFLPQPKNWTYEAIRAQIRYDHFFIPMMTEDRRPAGYPALAVESIAAEENRDDDLAPNG